MSVLLRFRPSISALVLVASIACAPAAQAGFLGHIAAYATGALVAHEAERYIDHRNASPSNRGNSYARAGSSNFQYSGRYGLVFPESDALPNPRLTPGALNPAVTQANIRETICRPGGYTRSIRPDEHYTEQLKREGIRQYGYVQAMGREAFRFSNYEEDHLVSLELGGSPTSPQNLWPEPHHVIGGWGSYAKDKLENRLHSLVCRGQIPLAVAQYDIAHDWVAAYKKYIGATPDQSRSHRYGG